MQHIGSPSGIQTQVTRVTGRYTHHYINKDSNRKYTSITSLDIRETKSPKRNCSSSTSSTVSSSSSSSTLSASEDKAPSPTIAELKRRALLLSSKEKVISSKYDNFTVEITTSPAQSGTSQIRHNSGKGRGRPLTRTNGSRERESSSQRRHREYLQNRSMRQNREKNLLPILSHTPVRSDTLGNLET